jgi:hypothetical protein
VAEIFPIRSGQVDRQLTVEKEEKKLSKRDTEACASNKKERRHGPELQKRA